MDKFKTVKSKAIPLPMKDVDTDLIIPAQYLTSISRDGFGANVFRRLRDKDPNFPLNLEKYRGAEILVADSNFGCGSSREHAVWAIASAGMKVVIGKSFADIFYSNSAKNGLLLVILEDAVVDELLKRAQSEDLILSVYLESQTVTEPNGKTHKFQYDSFRKHCLLNGLDDIDYMRSFDKEIADFRKEQNQRQPFSTIKR
jgi:3-isopropylmalate/(R)-2-methylmalate dehydratase small subunit